VDVSVSHPLVTTSFPCHQTLLLRRSTKGRGPSTLDVGTWHEEQVQECVPTSLAPSGYTAGNGEPGAVIRQEPDASTCQLAAPRKVDGLERGALLSECFN